MTILFLPFFGVVYAYKVAFLWHLNCVSAGSKMRHTASKDDQDTARKQAEGGPITGMQKLWQQIMQIEVGTPASVLLSCFPANVVLLANNNDNNMTSIKVSGTSHTENSMTCVCVCVCAHAPRDEANGVNHFPHVESPHFNFLIRIYYGELKTWRRVFHNFLSVVVCCSPAPSHYDLLIAYNCLSAPLHLFSRYGWHVA